jgi:predicted RNA-binding protein with PUA-like domain
MPKAAQYWLVKQEPTSYPWEQFVKDGRAAWTGVRNFQARNNLRAMREGDLVLYYHSVIGKEVVGIAKVAATAYRDPTAKDGDWMCVDLAPAKALKRPVTLEEIKGHAGSLGNGAFAQFAPFSAAAAQRRIRGDRRSRGSLTQPANFASTKSVKCCKGHAA